MSDQSETPQRKYEQEIFIVNYGGDMNRKKIKHKKNSIIIEFKLWS